LRHQGYWHKEVAFLENPTKEELSIFFDRLLLLQKEGPEEEDDGSLTERWRTDLARARERQAAGELVFTLPEAPPSDQELSDEALQAWEEAQANRRIDHLGWELFLQGIAEAREQANSEVRETMLFYYAGHGLAGDLDGNGPVGYFLPTDTVNQAVRLSSNDTLFPMEHVFTALHAFKSHHTLLILDCCFAGVFSRINTQRDSIPGFRPMSQYRFERYIKKRAWQVLVSAGPAELASDFISDRGEASWVPQQTTVDDRQHSPFALALLYALKREEGIDVKPRGRNLGDGVITAHELFLYLHRKMDEIKQDETDFNPQSPDYFTVGDHLGGQFVFVDPRHPKNEPDWSESSQQSPYKGLKVMDVADHDYYYGRERDVAILKQALGLPLDASIPAEQALLLNRSGTGQIDPALVLVAGPSGCGKSSLVKAGIMPELLRSKYHVFQFRPSRRPWAIQLCLRYSWKRTPYPSDDPSAYRIRIPKGGGVSKWIDLEGNDLDEHTNQVLSKFSKPINARHLIEQRELRKELKELLSITTQGSWTIELREEARWYTIVEGLPEYFTFVPELPADDTAPTFADTQVNLVEKSVLYIDQYEEIFTESTTVERLILEEQLQRCLHYAAQGKGYVLTSIRSDFEWQLELSTFGEQFWNSSAPYHQYFKQHRMVDLGLEDLRSALLNPALMQAYEFEEGLADEILEDLNYLPNGLPLLSLTMQQMLLYTSEEERLFLRQTYLQEVGSVSGVLSSLMDKLYKQFADDSVEGASPLQLLFQQIFLRLVKLSDGDYIRRRLFRKSDLDELALHKKEAEVEEILQALEDAQLIIRGADLRDELPNWSDPFRRYRLPYVELRHDSLINSWTIGKQWINDFAKENLSLQRQLWQAVVDSSPSEVTAATAGTIEESTTSTPQYTFEYLWDTNPKLIQIIQIIADGSTALLKQDPEALLAEVLAEHSAEFQTRFRVFWATCQEEEKFPDLSTLIIDGYSDILLHVFLLKGQHWLNLPEMAFVKQSWAERIKDILQLRRERDEAKALLAAARALQIVEDDPTAALNLALAAFRMHPTEESRSAILEVVASKQYRTYKEIPVSHNNQWQSLAISPDGKYILTIDQDQTAKLWYSKDGKLNGILTDYSTAVTAVTFAQLEGALFALTGDDNGTVLVQNLVTNKTYTIDTPGAIYNLVVATIGDKFFVLTRNADQKARIWDLDGELLHTIDIRYNSDRIAYIVTADGHFVLEGGNDTDAILRDQNGNEVEWFDNQVEPIDVANDVDMISRPDGLFVLTSVRNRDAYLWNSEGRILQTFPNHFPRTHIGTVAFGKNGDAILTVGNNQAKFWGRDGQLLESCSSLPATITQTALAYDSLTLVTTNETTDKIRIWEPAKGALLQTCTVDSYNALQVDFVEAGDEHYIFSTHVDRGAQIWNKQGEPVLP
ncbi:MAG: NACHT and WD repeat domain-containing protein, partial [Bacteroidota bacterium]